MNGCCISEELDYIEKLMQLAGYPKQVRSRFIVAASRFRGLSEEEFPRTCKDVRTLIQWCPPILHRTILGLIENKPCTLRQELEREVPEGVREMLEVPGLTTAAVRHAWKDHGIEFVEVLILAVKAGQVNIRSIAGQTRIALLRFEETVMPKSLRTCDEYRGRK